MKKNVIQKEQASNNKNNTKITRNRPLNSTIQMNTEQAKTINTQRDSNPKNQTQQTKNPLYDDEFISYINQLCDIIKVLNNSNMSNFSLVKHLLANYNKNENDQNKKQKEKENENINIKSLNNSFNHIETAFNSFYSNAKVLFRKMKKYKNENCDQKKISNPKINIENSTISTSSNKNIFNGTSTNFAQNDLSKENSVVCINSEHNEIKKIEHRSSSQKNINNYTINEKFKKKIPNNKKLFNFEKQFNYSYVCELMMFKSSIMKEIVQIIEKKNDLKGKYFYEKILDASKGQDVGFSEYETYGTYVYNYYPDLYEYKHLRKSDASDQYFPLDEEIFEYAAKSYDTLRYEKEPDGKTFQYMLVNNNIFRKLFKVHDLYKERNYETECKYISSEEEEIEMLKRTSKLK